MRVINMHGVVEFRKRNHKYGGRSHTIGQKPEKQVMITSEFPSGKGICPRHSRDKGNNDIQADIDNGVKKTVAPD